MTIYHLSMECYPVAKVGGLADVVGALPKYQNKFDGTDAKVVMPWYNKSFVHDHEFELVFDGFINQLADTFQVQVFQERNKTLGFDLFCIKIPGLLDRDNVYGYRDESRQYLAFQTAILHWLTAMEIEVNVLHCHDYHTGLIPFMVKFCPEFSRLSGLRTVGTIHNGEYQGSMPWTYAEFLPWYDAGKSGLLHWNTYINPLAAMIKCCEAFNAVSGGYMQELFSHFQGLEALVQQEYPKARGIINGIDTEVWDPETDPMLHHNYSSKNAGEGKYLNKLELCHHYGLNPNLPLFGFIGRFAGEKGADLLPEVIWKAIQQTNGQVNIIVLGSGNKYLEERLQSLNNIFTNLAIDLGYKEALSHMIYSSADFLLMPSRVEPCGLNQMYAMRYGTIPIVRYTGGLKDTVQDLSSGGAGLNFTNAGADDVVHAMHRALHIYYHRGLMDHLRYVNMQFDFSWENSAKKYLEMYQS